MNMSSTGLHALRLLAAVTALVVSMLTTTSAEAQSSVRPPDSAVDQGVTAPLGEQSDADIWRHLKEGGTRAPAEISGDTPIPMVPGRTQNVFETFLAEVGAEGTNITSNSGEARLVQVLGEDWRLLRRNFILPYSGWIIAGVIGLIALFALVRGKIKIRDGRSGKYIPRFSMAHRIAHWFLASSFILMALSGLVILLGRPLLVPLIGKEANAVLTSAMLQGHNLFGPVFILSLLVVILKFMKGNFFQWADFNWILKGGGLLGGHASSHHYNFGEKTWYWVVVIVGLMMSATGLLLLFPWVTDVLAWHQLSSVLHVAGAILMISFAIGHAYVGSIGMEGSLELDAARRGRRKLGQGTP